MRRAFSFLVYTLAGALCTATAWPQSYPTKPIRVIVGFGAGAPDTVARLIAQQMSAQVVRNYRRPYAREDKTHRHRP